MSHRLTHVIHTDILSLMARKQKPGDEKRVVAYLRVSTDDQLLGPEAQLSTMRTWGGANNAELIDIFQDHGVSGGADLDKRPGLLDALDSLKKHNAGILLVAKRDRLARDVVIAATIERVARRKGAKVVSADGTGNGDTPADEFMRTVIDGAAQYERALIKARTRAALQVKRSRGQKTGGAVPFGYRLAEDGIHLSENDREQEIIDLVRQLRDRGQTIRAIAEHLNQEDYPSRGRKWYPTSVARILEREAA